ncbi:MAG: DUF58 domain-containing protein [Phycisphaerae bacterium]|nr:DUF58 domain-containing protein [Phycisphaerae bacterium]
MTTAELFDEPFLRKLEQLRLLAKRLALRGRPGRRRSRRIGDGLEFADHRDYAPGEDVRFIDWSYYARMEKLLLRLFHEHAEGDVCIVLDCSASMADFAYARRLAAALAYVAMGSLERVVIQPFADDLLPPLRTARGREHILSVLNFLRRLAPSGHTQLERCSQRLAQQGQRHGSVLLISDLLDASDDLPRACLHLRQHNDLAVLHLIHPADARPTATGQVVLRQAETDDELPLDITPELLHSYGQQWQTFLRHCESAVTSRGGTYLAAETTTPFEDVILHMLRQANVLS